MTFFFPSSITQRLNFQVWLKNSLRHLLATTHDLPRGFRASSLGENEAPRKWVEFTPEGERAQASHIQLTEVSEDQTIRAAVGETEETRVSAH